MGSKVVHLVESKQTSTRDASRLVQDVSVTLDSTLCSAREELKVGRVLNHEHVSASCASTSDGTVELKGPSLATAESDPSGHGVVSSWNLNDTTVLAGVEGRGDGGANVGLAVCLAAIVQDAAGLDLCLGSDGSQRTDSAGELSYDQRRGQDGGSEKGG